MTIMEQVVQTLCKYASDDLDICASAVIATFLAAAAKPDEDGVCWHMRPDEPTAEAKVAITDAWLDGKPPAYMYRAMLAAAPKFEWDK